MMSELPFSLRFHDASALDVEVLYFELYEAISQTYALHVVAHPLVSPLPVVPSELVGTRVTLTIENDGSARRVHGVVGQVELDFLESAVLRLVVVPQLQTLSIGRDSRIFQNRATIDIAETLLREHGVEVETRLVASYPPRVYCVQYQESTLAFIERLLADEGIFYFFEHASDTGPEKLVIADHAGAYAGAAGDNALHHRPETGAGMQTDQGAVLRFWAESVMAPTQVSLATYDFVQPRAPWSGVASGDAASHAQSDAGLGPRATGTREQFRHQPSWHHGELLNGRATTALAQSQRDSTRHLGTTLARRLTAGHLMQLSGHALSELDGSYVVVQARHEGRGAPHLDEGRYRMITSFQCVAAAAAFRPALPERQLRQVVETALVVGPSLESIHTDEHGRIKVQFYWDRDGKTDDATSCWMRVMQPWSGPGMGTQFIPRVGSEVLVSFLGGNVDQPVVLGGLHNPINMHPFNVPEHRSASGIRSNCLGGSGGYNELRFEDEQGGEKITLHAHNSLTHEVGGDSDADVGRNQIVRVGGDAITNVGGRLEQTVAGDIMLTTGATRTDSIGASFSMVVGSELTTRVGSHLATTVGGSLKESIVGAATRAVDGVCTTTARRGLFVNVGDPDANANSTTFVHGAAHHGATGVITLNAEQGIRLVCGDTVLAITPDSLTISSGKISITGTDETHVFGKDAQILLGSDAEVSAPNVNMISSGASVELNQDADIFGAEIHLNCDRGKATEVSEDEEPPETTTLEVSCSNAAGEPYASKPFVLLVDGVRYAGTTTGSGGVSQDIPKDSAHATLTLWIGDYPQGERRVYELELGTLEGADTLAGARARLTNLGYAPGSGEELDPTTQDALERFQLDRGLEPTAELDGDTIAALNE